MTNSVNLPAPYMGVDQKIPNVALKSPYCEDLLNFNITPAGISLRYGDKKYSFVTAGSAAFYSNRLFAYGDSKLFVLISDDVAGFVRLRDVGAGATVYSIASTTSNLEFQALYFNKYLFFFGETSYAPGFYYNGTTYGATGYTGSGFDPVGGDAYNARAYFIQRNEAAYWYTDQVYAISGPVIKIDLSGIITVVSTLAVIAPITISSNASTETYQAFVFFSGEVFFYRGPYPDSDNWSLIGTARIGQPINYNCSIAYQGDSLILCDTGVISLRDLFLNGSEAAASLTVNSNIQKTWTSLVSQIRVVLGSPTGRVAGIHGAWDPSTNRIVISFPYYPNGTITNFFPSMGGFQFVFYTILQSWSFHRSFGLTGPASQMLDIIRYQNKLLLLSKSIAAGFMIWEKEGDIVFTDRSISDATDVGYDYTMLSAPIPFPKTAVYEATQIEPIVKSDLYAQTNWNLVVDFGRQTSGSQQTDASTTTVAKPAVNVGMQNITFVQVKMSGTTVASKAVGLDLYSYNVWYNSGESGSR